MKSRISPSQGTLYSHVLIRALINLKICKEIKKVDPIHFGKEGSQILSQIQCIKNIGMSKKAIVID